MFNWLSQFRLAVLELHLEARDTIILPAFKGSTLRGAFGHAFRRITCVNRTKGPKECGDCSLIEVCPYHYVFESSPLGSDSGKPEGPLSNYDDVPRPFVIEPPTDTREVYEAGETIVFRVILIGNGIEFFPYFIVAFRELGEEGIGKDRRRGAGRFELKRVRGLGPPGDHLLYDGDEGKVYNVRRFWFTAEEACREWLSSQAHGTPAGQRRPGDELDNEASKTPSASAGTLTRASATRMTPSPCSESCRQLFEGIRYGEGRLIVGFETPCRLKYERHLVDVPEFHILIRNLLRRVSSLARFHHSFEVDVDFRGLIESSLNVELIQNRTRWVDWERYSARQSSRMRLGGIMGVAVYRFVDGAARVRHGSLCASEGCRKGLEKGNGMSGSRHVDRSKHSTAGGNGMSGGDSMSGSNGPSGGDGPPPVCTSIEFLLPFIAIGQYVHVGKNVTFGLGKLRSILELPQ